MANLPNESDDEPDESIEESLVHALWDWSAIRPEDVEAKNEAVAEVAPWLEALVSGSFELSESPVARSWWTDGFEVLELIQVSPECIQAVAVIYWADDDTSRFYLAPVECDFHFAAPRDLQCSRIVIRFGALAESGEIAKLPIYTAVAEILSSRPTENSRWAFAVEVA